MAKEDPVNLGPLVERPESPHLSVISEASTDDSNHDGWKTVASMGARSRKDEKVGKKGREECEKTSDIISSPPKTTTCSENKSEESELETMAISYAVGGEDKGVQPHVSDFEEDLDKTLSEATPPQIISETSTHYADNLDAKMEEDADITEVLKDSAQPKVQRSTTTNSREEDSNEMDFGPTQSQDVKEGERSTTLTPPECP
ncbi:unnamed protein product, partial [Hydatigera taeniaeformis]|uniref:CAP-ZIP_m domain-containing protein n=1 Tax=Hydatigena taeniaeformis TaxID=6205 RepID=A0A0R3WUF2_HYDTA